MSTDPRARQPKGIPTGGQFATSQRTEADVDLDLDPTAATDFRGTPVERMSRTACMAILNPRRMHPALVGRNVSAEYPVETLRDMVDQVREHDAEHGTWEPPVRTALDAYAEEAEAIRIEHATVTEGFDHLDPEEQERRRTEVADHYENVALRAANQIPADDLPGPGQVILSGQYGRLVAAAEAAATERARRYGPADRETIEATTDALVGKVLDTRDVTAANGVPFRVRLVRKGMGWGRNGSLTAEQDMVFVFDARYPDFDPMIGHRLDDRHATERNGQFVSNYAVETLRSHPTGAGINLHGGVDDWTIDGDTFARVATWMDRRAPNHDERSTTP